MILMLTLFTKVNCDWHDVQFNQVRMKDDATKKRRADEEFLERLEQVQLAEEWVDVMRPLWMF